MNAHCSRVTRRTRTGAALGIGALCTVLALGLGVREVAAQQIDPEALELVESWIDALGGMEQYHNLRTAQFTLTTEMYEASSGRLRRARPRYVTIAQQPGVLAARIERWEGDNFIVQGWDGETDWAYMNGQRLTSADKDQLEVRYVSGDVNYWIGLPFKLKDPGVNLHYDGRDEGGRHVVRVNFGEGIGNDAWHYYFVDGRTWPVQVDYQVEGTTRANHTRWEEIESTDGYYYVGARVHFDDQGRVFKVIRMDDVKINDDLDPEVFSRLGSSTN